MFEAIIAACLIVQPGGAPSNPCWIGTHPELFRTRMECLRFAAEKELKARKEAAERYNLPGVASVVCAETMST